MLNVEIPLFDLKGSNEYIFLAGGGGSKEYGKDNGVMAIKKSVFNEKLEKVTAFYKTSDFIVYLQIFFVYVYLCKGNAGGGRGL